MSQLGVVELGFLEPSAPGEGEASPSMTAYNEAVLADSPYAYWAMETAAGNEKDLTAGKRDGVYTGEVTRTQAPLISTGNSVLFNSSLSTGKMEATGGSVSGTFTVEVWVKQAELPGYPHGYVLGSRAVGHDNSFDLTIGNESIASNVGSGTGWIETGMTTGAPAVKAGARIHLVAVVKPEKIDWYTNGAIAGTHGMPAGTPLLWDATHPVTIGLANQEANDGKKMDVDEVAIYAGALSAERILAHYNIGIGSTVVPAAVTMSGAGELKATASVTSGALPSYTAAVTADNPYAWFHMNASAGTTEVDAGSNKQNATYVETTGGELKLSQAGIIGRGEDTSVGFNPGLNHKCRLQFPTAGEAKGKFSFECWLYPTELETERQVLDTSAALPGLKIELVAGVSPEGAYVRVEVGDGSAAVMTVTSAAEVITRNAWHHLVVTMDEAAGIKVYVNGAVVAEEAKALASALMWNATCVPRLAHAVAVSGAYYRGRGDEVAVYSSVLSGARVKIHYEAGITVPPSEVVRPGKLPNEASPPPERLASNLGATTVTPKAMPVLTVSTRQVAAAVSPPPERMVATSQVAATVATRQTNAEVGTYV
jgi:hypothetical protein